MSSESFLSRWSRRKLEVREAEQPDRASPAPADSAEAEGAGEAAAAETGRADDAAGGDELTPDEIARLPSVEELTAEMDLSLFMRKGVPHGLRKAALRRMWSLDPNIRDYVSEAREYAYDWNVPGGVPGSGGALPPADEIRRLAEQIVGGHRPSETRAAEPEGGDAEPPADGTPREDAEAQAAHESPPDSSGPDQPDAALPQQPTAALAEPLVPVSTGDTDGQAAAPRRRHGGAKPC
jgi:hypothetical protein